MDTVAKASSVHERRHREAGAAQTGGKASPGPDEARATSGEVRRWLERTGEVTGGLQTFSGAVRADEAASVRSEGWSMLLGPVRSGDSCWSDVLLTGAAGRTVKLAGEDDADPALTRRRREGNPRLRGGKAREEGV